MKKILQVGQRSLTCQPPHCQRLRQCPHPLRSLSAQQGEGMWRPLHTLTLHPPLHRPMYIPYLRCRCSQPRQPRPPTRPPPLQAVRVIVTLTQHPHHTSCILLTPLSHCSQPHNPRHTPTGDNECPYPLHSGDHFPHWLVREILVQIFVFLLLFMFYISVHSNSSVELVLR